MTKLSTITEFISSRFNAKRHDGNQLATNYVTNRDYAIYCVPVLNPDTIATAIGRLEMDSFRFPNQQQAIAGVEKDPLSPHVKHLLTQKGIELIPVNDGLSLPTMPAQASVKSFQLATVPKQAPKASGGSKGGFSAHPGYWLGAILLGLVAAPGELIGVALAMGTMLTLRYIDNR